jgi:integrase
MGLGSARDVPLARAREKATEARALLADGRNPIEVRQREAAVPTFGDCADELIESLRPSWRNDKHAAQWSYTLGELARPVRHIRVDLVTTDDVLKVLQPIWQSTPDTASRLRGRIERVLDTAKARGHRTGENCARWRGHLNAILPPPKKLSRGHHPAMPYRDVPQFVLQLQSDPTIVNLAFELTILAAARSGEVMGARPQEFDRIKKIWTVPAERMKGNVEHRVPLTHRMLEIVAMAERLGAGAAFLFPGRRRGRPISNMTFEMTMRRVGADEFTPHGFRSSFRDWAGDETSFPREVVEAALAHAIPDATEAAYRRGDALEKRRALMGAWQEYLSLPPGRKVVHLKSTRTV